VTHTGDEEVARMQGQDGRASGLSTLEIIAHAGELLVPRVTARVVFEEIARRVLDRGAAGVPAEYRAVLDDVRAADPALAERVRALVAAARLEAGTEMLVLGVRLAETYGTGLDDLDGWVDRALARMERAAN
jgi:hypothetical protein